MAKTKTQKDQTRVQKKTISPFKEKKELEQEIKSFVNKFKSTVKNQATRISDFFEMSCFNYIVRFYEHHDYEVEIKNLQEGEYRYKCSPAGIQSNYSYFSVTKKIGTRQFKFEIQHNLAVQSSFDPEIFTNPDIVVIREGTSKTTIGYYETKRRFSFVQNKNAITFVEVKHFNPFPELIFNFMGIVNEIKKDIMTNTASAKRPIHLAPSLMVSGKANRQTERIKNSLEERYCINIIYDLFDSGTQTFSRFGVSKLKTTGKNQPLTSDIAHASK